MREPSTDLAIALAVASSYYDRPISQTMAVVGELGLAGELRCAPSCSISRGSAKGKQVSHPLDAGCLS